MKKNLIKLEDNKGEKDKNTLKLHSRVFKGPKDWTLDRQDWIAGERFLGVLGTGV